MRKCLSSLFIIVLFFVIIGVWDKGNELNATTAWAAFGRPDFATANNSPIGINLSDVNDWSTEQPFLDLFRTARPWSPQCGWNDPGCDTGQWSTGEEHLLDLDTNGWVKSLPGENSTDTRFTFASTLLFSRDERDGMAGRYVVLYDGFGTLEYDLGATLIESVHGRDIIEVSGDRTIRIKVTETDPTNYVRNIHIFREEYQSSWRDEDIFNPALIEKLQPFSTIRFMGWMQTNNSTQGNWDDRPTSENAFYSTDKGVPLELMIRLANDVDRDPWFNIPHRADERYIRNFAEMVRDDLDDDLAVYVEHSNEVWNGSFHQYQYAVEQGEAMFRTGSPFEKAMNWHGRRTAEICAIWREIFAQTGEKERVRCVAGSQSVQANVSEMILDCSLWDRGPCVDYGIEYLATAPYFGYALGNPARVDEIAGWSLDQLFHELETYSLPEAVNGMIDSARVADNYGINLVAYEGGQHLAGFNGAENNQQAVDLFTAANRDPRMGDLYSRYLDEWRRSGGELMVHFSLSEGYTKWGSWGLIEYITQRSSVKYDAVVNFINDNPCWWGCVQPTATPTNTPTNTPTPTHTNTPTHTPTSTPTHTHTPTITPSHTPTHTPTPTNTGTPSPSATPTKTPRPTQTDTPSPSDTPTPSALQPSTNTPDPDSVSQNSTATSTSLAPATVASTRKPTATIQPTRGAILTLSTNTPRPTKRPTLTKAPTLTPLPTEQFIIVADSEIISPNPPQILIEALQSSVVKRNDGSWQPYVEVQLRVEDLSAANGVAIIGSFSGSGGAGECVTNAQSVCTIEGSPIAADTDQVTFHVQWLDRDGHRTHLPLTISTDEQPSDIIVYRDGNPTAVSIRQTISNSQHVAIAGTLTIVIIILFAILRTHLKHKTTVH